MYDYRFKEAVGYDGKPLRAENGDLIQYCGHSWIAKVKEETVGKNHAALTYFTTDFSAIEMLCIRCGTVDWIGAKYIFTDEEFDKEVEEALKEIKPKKKGRKAL